MLQEGPAKGHNQHQDQSPGLDQQPEEQEGKAEDRGQAVIGPEPFQESGHKCAAVRGIRYQCLPFGADI